MGSQSRKSSGRGGRRGGGGGRGSEGEKRPVNKETERVIQKAFKKLDDALSKKNFPYVADIVTSISISRAPSSDLTNLILAGAKAFREAKEKDWKPELRALADSGVRFAQEKTGHTLTSERRELYSDIITNNLKRTAEQKGRKTP